MLTEEQKIYLTGRGYTEELLREEGVFGATETTTFHGRKVKDCAGCLAWPVYSMSGEPIGVQTRELAQKKYRFHQLPHTEHLPLIFGTKEDWDLLWGTGKMILTEGAFDRVAIKRATPDRAVFARMSKGAPNQLRSLIKRYVVHLWTAFDNDEAGEEATQDAETKLKGSTEVSELKFPYKDPAKMLEKRGLKPLRELLQKQLATMET